MTDPTPSAPSRRPEFRNVNAFSDLPSYRLPAAGWVSILHRISGALMFLLLPLVIWLFDASVSSEVSHAKLRMLFSGEGAIPIPAWVVKLVALALIWAYLHHLVAGLRHLWMDATHAVSKAFGHGSAVFTLVTSIAITAALGAKLFGVY